MPNYVIPAFIVVKAPDSHAADDAAAELQNKANRFFKEETGFVMLDEVLPTTKLKDFAIPSSILELYKD